MTAKIVVMTSDKQIHALRGFAYLFNKYWSRYQEVVVAGFSEPDFDLPANFSFYSIGAQEDYPFKKWSNALLAFMDAHPDWHHFIIMLEDYWLTRPVNRDAVGQLLSYAVSNHNVLRVDLCADRLYAAGMRDFCSWYDLDIIKSDPESQYHMSLWTSLWNADLLRRVIIPEESPHDIELEGTTRLRAFKDSMLVVGTRQYPIRHITAYKHGMEQVNLEGLHAGDILALKEMGYL